MDLYLVQLALGKKKQKKTRKDLKTIKIKMKYNNNDNKNKQQLNVVVFNSCVLHHKWLHALRMRNMHRLVLVFGFFFFSFLFSYIEDLILKIISGFYINIRCFFFSFGKKNKIKQNKKNKNNVP